MKPATKIALAVSAATATVGLVATPAFAASYDWSNITVGDFTWSPYESELLPDELTGTTYDDGFDSNSFNVWDDTGAIDYTAVECANPQISEPGDTAGGQLITCDTFDIVDSNSDVVLTAKPEFRIFADGNLGRYFVTLSNPTSSAVPYSWEWDSNFGEGTVWETEYQNGSSPDATEDNWLVSNGDSGSTLPVTLAFGSADGTDRAEVIQVSSDDVNIWSDNDDSEQKELAAGNTVSYAMFIYSNDISSNTISELITLWENSTTTFGGPGGTINPTSVAETATPYATLFASSPCGEYVANWGHTTEDCAPEPELPNTGTDSNLGIWATVAGLITAVGVAGVVMSRRRQSRA